MYIVIQGGLIIGEVKNPADYRLLPMYDSGMPIEESKVKVIKKEE